MGNKVTSAGDRLATAEGWASSAAAGGARGAAGCSESLLSLEWGTATSTTKVNVAACAYDGVSRRVAAVTVRSET